MVTLAYDLKFTKCTIKKSPIPFPEASGDNSSLRKLCYYPHFPDGRVRLRQVKQLATASPPLNWPLLHTGGRRVSSQPFTDTRKTLTKLWLDGQWVVIMNSRWMEGFREVLSGPEVTRVRCHRRRDGDPAAAPGANCLKQKAPNP